MRSRVVRDLGLVNLMIAYHRHWVPMRDIFFRSVLASAKVNKINGKENVIVIGDH